MNGVQSVKTPESNVSIRTGRASWGGAGTRRTADDPFKEFLKKYFFNNRKDGGVAKKRTQ